MPRALRVRFAPSPTGYLHIGGARTALYNWLWARRHGGAFVLRIENTDSERSTETAEAVVYESLRWLGLDWDEGPDRGGRHGPYRQTERRRLYQECAETLISRGHAFRCYATKEEIDRQRKEFAAAGGKGFRFVSPWRDKTAELDRPHVVRLRAPTDGKTGWHDRIKGDVAYPNSQQQDVVLLRSDGLPLYNFGAVIDDLEMGISLVARGDDHLVNTPIQILLYRALDAEVPEFAHVPLILGSKREKLSKRHAAVAVLDYRDEGFLPEAVNNYLARIGWSHGDQEIFSTEELIEHFSWDHVGTSGATYDRKKFDFVQAEHLRGRTNDELATLATPFCEAHGFSADDPCKLALAIGYVKPRVTTLKDVAHHVEYFFRDDFEYDDAGRQKFLRTAAAPTLRSLLDVLTPINATSFDVDTLTAKVTAWMESEGITMKDFAQAVRLSLSGRTRTPGLYEVMDVLGRDATLARLERGASVAESSE